MMMSNKKMFTAGVWLGLVAGVLMISFLWSDPSGAQQQPVQGETPSSQVCAVTTGPNESVHPDNVLEVSNEFGDTVTIPSVEDAPNAGRTYEVSIDGDNVTAMIVPGPDGIWSLDVIVVTCTEPPPVTTTTTTIVCPIADAVPGGPCGHGPQNDTTTTTTVPDGTTTTTTQPTTTTTQSVTTTTSGNVCQPGDLACTGTDRLPLLLVLGGVLLVGGLMVRRVTR